MAAQAVNPNMNLLNIFVRLGSAGIAAYCWWKYNIELGNAVAIEALGIFATLPEIGSQVLIPVAGSITQLYWDEELDLGVLRHPSTATFCVTVAIFDVLGPAYGFIATQGLTVNIITVIFALLWSIFFSIVCQEFAWRTIRDIVLWAKAQITRKRVRRGRGGTHGP